MARKKTTQALPHRINTALAEITRAANERDRERHEYNANPHPWSVEAERHRAAIDERADDAIRRAAAEIDAERAGIATEFERRRQTRFDPVEVESSWRRVEKLLEAGRTENGGNVGPGLDNVIGRPGFSREEAEGLRRNYLTWLAAQSPQRDPGDVEREHVDDVDRILVAELPLMPEPERVATEREVGARAAMTAVASIGKFLAGPRDAQSQIALGVALTASGFEPEPEPEDPARDAERERNSLPPDLKAKLDEGIRRNGRSDDAAAEPFMPVFPGLGE